MTDVNPTSLVESMKQAYGSLRTYRSKGILTNAHIKEGSREEETASYSVCFSREQGIRVDHRWQGPPSDGWPRKDVTVWGTGKTVKVFKRDTVTEVSLREGLIHEVLLENPILPAMVGLLMPGELRMEELITTLGGLTFTGPEEVAGHPCHVIVGHTQKDRQDEFTLFLDQNSILLRKIVQRTDFGPTVAERRAADNDARLEAVGVPREMRPPFKKARNHDFVSQRTLTIDPIVDHPIEPSELNFQPLRPMGA